MVRDSGCQWRGPDLNRRPRGYEPRELPDCSTPRQCMFSAVYVFDKPCEPTPGSPENEPDEGQEVYPQMLACRDTFLRFVW